MRAMDRMVGLNLSVWLLAAAVGVINVQRTQPASGGFTLAYVQELVEALWRIKIVSNVFSLMHLLQT